jgi:3-oxoacyl-[acyl-carrier protein] reductase
VEINLRDKTALVTGAGSGIGRSIAVELARSGAHVIVNYRSNQSGAEETLRMIEAAGGTGQIVGADVAKTDQVAQMISQIEHLDILINNAGGLVKRSKVADMSDDLFDQVLAINVRSTFLCCRAALPIMIGSGWGRIVNMSSLAGHDGGGAGASAYAASKAAIMAFTKGLAKEVAKEGITVNCVAPGLINTAFHDVHSTPEMRQATVKAMPLAREGQPIDVARVVLFLASDMASFITGETLNINGGARMQ